MKQDITRDERERAANDLLDDIVAGLKQFTFVECDDPELEAAQLMKLLDRNFELLDYDQDGISRGELSRALARRTEFAADEYTYKSEHQGRSGPFSHNDTYDPSASY